MRNRRYIFFSAIGFLIAAVLTLSISFFNFSISPVSEYSIKYCTQHIQKAQRNARNYIAQLNTKEDIARVSPHNISHDMAIFVFEGQELVGWVHDIPVDQNEIRQIDSTTNFRKLNHAWYLTRGFHRGNLYVVSTFLIKTDYPGENKSYANTINPALGFHGDFNIESPGNDEKGFIIQSIDGLPLLSIYPGEKERKYEFNILIRWISVICLIIAVILLFNYSRTYKTFPLFAFILIGVRAILFYSGTFFKGDLKLFSPLIYSDSCFLCSLGDLMLHVIFVFLIVRLIYHRRKIWEIYLSRTTRRNKTIWTVLSLSIIAASCWAIHYILRSLVLNSSISFKTLPPTTFDEYSLIVYSTLAIIFATFFLMIHIFIRCYFPQWLNAWRKQSIALIYLLLIPVYTVMEISIYDAQFDKHQNIILAYKFAMQHDPIAEMFLQDIESQLNKDSTVYSYLKKPEAESLITDYLRKRYFHGYLGRYDLGISLCPPDSPSDKNFHEQINLRSDPLNDNSMFYYINNYRDHNTYIGMLCYREDNTTPVNIYIELNLKRLSNDRGYSELLLKKDVANMMFLPPRYAYAKYFNKKLSEKDGAFDYRNNLLPQWDTNEFSTVFEDENYTHHVYKMDNERTIVISRENRTFFNNMTAYSYLLLLFSFVFYSTLYVAGWRIHWFWKNNTLRRRITILSLVLIILSLITGCTLNLLYSIIQYKESNNKNLEARVETMIKMLDPLLNNLKSDNIQQISDLYITLLQVSNNFPFDINIYDTRGNLIISSRPEIFSQYLQSRRMNFEALAKFKENEIYRYIHKEHIGQLSFQSIYIPYYNEDDELIAYVNIPHFSNQKEITEDISKLITTYANIYILLLIVALFMSIALSNQIMQPIEIIRRNMRNFKSTGEFEYIDYDASDELGELISSYNEMITLMNDNNRKLIQAEREGAWRNMAQQIAHEIKNPLTPMRLSIQHLLRLKQNNAPGWQERFEEISKALLEQIETLAKTAAEFSSFTKTEMEDTEIIDLNIVLQEQLSLFSHYPNIKVELRSAVMHAYVIAHYEKINRILTNILTNAVQAIGEMKQMGQITVTLYEQNAHYCIAIEDNGHGIDKTMQEKLFTPNFTTKRSGSGFGLSICRNIVENYGGSICYNPSVTGGACFTICLPKLIQ